MISIVFFTSGINSTGKNTAKVIALKSVLYHIIIVIAMGGSGYLSVVTMYYVE